MVLSEMIWAGPVRAELNRGSAAAGDGNFLQLYYHRRQSEVDGQALAEREEDGIPPCRLVADRPDLDPVGPADRQIFEEVPTLSTGPRLPALAVGGVDDVDNRLLDRRARRPEHPAMDGSASGALGDERGGGRDERGGQGEDRERSPLHRSPRREA